MGIQTVKYLITSALPYINGVKHLGNLIGSMLPGDVYARFLRQQNKEVLYICGTDEHGTPAEIAAIEAGMGIREYCDLLHTQQKEIYEGFNLSFDYFGRSSTESNKQFTQEIFLELDKNNLIIERELDQVYSKQDQRFLPDRYITGTCPHCAYDKARGDQCDQCGKLLNPVDLIKPKSAISGSEDLETRKEKHLFFNLEKMSETLKNWIDSQESKPGPKWPNLSISIAKKWLSEGLKERCISRDLDWGVPIPKKGYEHKVFYVWFDAPMAYVSITQDWAREVKKSPEDWKRWWLNSSEGQDQDTHYVQFMAKDNVAFHSIIWPAALLGAGLNSGLNNGKSWKMVDVLKSFHWLTYENGKFSTSQKRGIFSDVALTLFKADCWRYYLMANIPESHDSDFKFPDFVGVINKDLVGTLGNFVNRVAALVKKYFDNKVPDYKNLENKYLDELNPLSMGLVREINQDYFDLNFRSALRKIRELWCLGNEFISRSEPWKVAKTNLPEAGEILAACLNLMRVMAIVSFPVIPETSEKIFEYLGLDKKDLAKLNSEDLGEQAGILNLLKPGQDLSDIGLLFEKISPEQEAELVERFGV